ncbi:hypothetical protein F4818DRAFT_405457 [Hypoxylon cercidicola]|nr:hypothetical protein F4818DRAFT_405457 [Hypoxylon cercidicola]
MSTPIYLCYILMQFNSLASCICGFASCQEAIFSLFEQRIVLEMLLRHLPNVPPRGPYGAQGAFDLHLSPRALFDGFTTMNGHHTRASTGTETAALSRVEPRT